MAMIDDIQFEVERSGKIFKPTTTMPDSTALGYDANPNDATTATPGATLLVNSPLGTFYTQSNGTLWFKEVGGAAGNWINLSGGSGGGVGGEPIYIGDANTENSWMILRDISDNFDTYGPHNGVKLNDAKLHFFRWETDKYLTKTQMGNSLHTDKVFITEESGGYHVPSGDGDNQLIISRKSNRGTHGIIEGNYYGRLALATNSKQTLFHSYPEANVQVLSTVDEDTANWIYSKETFLELQTPILPNLHILTEFTAWTDTDGIAIRIQINYTDTGELLYESQTDHDFKLAPKAFSVNGKYIVTLINPVAVDGNRQVTVRLYSATPLGLRRHVTSTFPHMLIKYQDIVIEHVATKEDSGRTEYAEREADRAFTLHDILGEGLADQDGNYLSFNHSASHAFQEETSTDFAWASHYRMPDTQQVPRTLHLHGNDSMLSLMNGDPLSFDGGPAVEPPIVGATGRLAQWVEATGNGLPTLTLDLPLMVSLTPIDDIVVTASRDGVEYMRLTLSPESAGFPTQDVTTTYGANAGIRDNIVDSGTLLIRITFRSSVNGSVDVTYNQTIPQLAAQATGVAVVSGAAATTRWTPYKYSEGIGGFDIPMLEVYIPAFNAGPGDQPSIQSVRLTFKSVIIYENVSALYRLNHPAKWIQIPPWFNVTSTDDIPWNEELNMYVQLYSASGYERFHQTGDLIITQPASDNRKTDYVSTSNGSEGTPGIARFDCHRDGWHFADEVAATIIIDVDGGQSTKDWFAHDVDIWVHNDKVNRFSVTLHPFTNPLNATPTSYSPDTATSYNINIRNSVGSYLGGDYAGIAALRTTYVEFVRNENRSFSPRNYISI